MTILEVFYKANYDEDALMLDKIKGYVPYDATPIGARVFACMGVDGVHYCVMPRDNDATLENSPIYRVSPMDFSERTIVWTAKNFYDFIRVSVELRDFWLLPCLIGMDEKEFHSEIETSNYEFDIKNDTEKQSILHSIESLQKQFNTGRINNLYSYVQEAYSDRSNHMQLTFSIPNIVEDTLGIYHYL